MNYLVTKMYLTTTNFTLEMQKIRNSYNLTKISLADLTEQISEA